MPSWKQLRTIHRKGWNSTQTDFGLKCQSTLAKTTTGTRSPQFTATPLEATVFGLMCYKEDLRAAATSLSVDFCDCTHRVGPLYQTLQCAHRSVHVYHDNLVIRDDPEAALKREGDRSSSNFRVHSVDTAFCVDRYNSPIPAFDTRELITQCKDRVGMDSIRFDRLSICQMSFTQRVQGGIESPDEVCEVVSIPLP